MLSLLHQQAYPAALLRPVLASCHPGLDGAYLNLDLLPAALLLAPRFPAALVHSNLDPLLLELAHGCDLQTFVSEHLNGVLRGEMPLYPGLPALDIRYYHQLLQLTPRPSRLAAGPHRPRLLSNGEPWGRSVGPGPLGSQPP